MLERRNMLNTCVRIENSVKCLLNLLFTDPENSFGSDENAMNQYEFDSPMV